MPTITNIELQKRNKNRANIYIDGEFAFGLEMITVMSLALKVGKEVSEQQLAEAVFDSEKSVAFDKAVGYISRAMKTEKQMKDYLVGKGFSTEVIDYVIDKLKEYGYIDDKKYVELYVSQNVKTKGAIRLKHELSAKGLSRQNIDENVVIDKDIAQDNANELAEKYMRNKPHDLATVQKLQRYLLSRGYDYDTISSVTAKYRSTDDN